MLVSIVIFSLLFSVYIDSAGSFFLLFGLTAKFAFPVGLLYLPFVVALADPTGRRFWIVLFSGSLIGPASLAVWGLVLQLRGADPGAIWEGNGIDIGLGVAIVCAAVVGSLTTVLYVTGLKIMLDRPNLG
ncbi:MAG TPA: hypothetical protein VGD59_11770 [Acidisarcina sp.]